MSILDKIKKKVGFLPLYDMTLKNISNLYSQGKISEEQYKLLLRDIYLSGLNSKGDMSHLYESIGGGLSIEASIGTDSLNLPFITANAYGKVEGSIAREHMAIVERQENQIDLDSTYRFFILEGFSGRLSGEVGASASFTASPIKTTDILSVMEELSFDLEAEVKVSGSMSGLWRDLYARKYANYKNITSSPGIADSFSRFVKAKTVDSPEIIKTDKATSLSKMSMWSAGLKLNAEASGSAGGNTEIKLQDDLAAKINIGLFSNAKFNAGYDVGKYRIQTTDAKSQMHIQDTKLTFKNIAANTEITADLISKIDIFGKKDVKGPNLQKALGKKDWVFLNSIEYEATVGLFKANGETDLNHSSYVRGHSIAIQKWRQYFQTEYLEYKNNPIQSPYIALLSKKLMVSPEIVAKFIEKTSGLVNDIMTSNGVDMTALILESSFAPASAMKISGSNPDGGEILKTFKGDNAKNNQLLDLRLKYCLRDAWDNSGSVSIAGFGVGFATVKLGLNWIRTASFGQAIDLARLNDDSKVMSHTLFI